MDVAKWNNVATIYIYLYFFSLQKLIAVKGNLFLTAIMLAHFINNFLSINYTYTNVVK